MKIHYIISSLESGGAEFAIPKIVQTIQSFGHEVDITACRAGDRAAIPRLEAVGLGYHIFFEKRSHPLKELWALLKYLKRKRPDVIWTSLSHATIIGQIAGKILGIPVVSWKNSASCRNYLKYSKNLTELWISDSNFVADYLKNKMKIPPSHVMSWPLYHCQEHCTLPSYWDGKEVLQIGTTGRLHEVKNYPALIKAIALFRQRNPDKAHMLHLSFAGDGPQRGELEALIKQENLEDAVSLLGFLEDPTAFLQKIHVYAQPSRYEGMCLAVHEAMAIGLPIIATSVGEMRNSVRDHQTGFTVSHEDLAKNICHKIEHIFENPSCLEEYGKAARAYVLSHYSEEAYRAHCGKILERIEQRIF